MQVENKLHRAAINVKKPDMDSFLLLIWLCEMYPLTVIRFIFSRLGLSAGLLRSALLWGVAMIPVVLLILLIQRTDVRKYTGFFSLYFLIIISMLVSLVANPALKEFFARENYGIDRILRPDSALYAFLFISAFEDSDKLKKTITTFAYLDFAYLVVVDLIPALLRGYWYDIGPDGSEMSFSYSLSFGYAVVFPTIVFFYQFIKEKKPAALIFAIAGGWCVVTQGNRGALLVLILFFGLMIISHVIVGKLAVEKKLLIIGIVLVGLLIAAVFGKQLMDLVSSLFTKGTVKSRSIRKLLNGSFTEDNGREEIWLAAIDAIKTGGLFGHGMLGDRPFVSPIHVAGYSHNLFLELAASYGVIGVIVIIIIVCDAVRMILLCRDDTWRELYIIFFSVSCQLLISMSFWYVWEFWAAAAVAYRYKKLRKQQLLMRSRRANNSSLVTDD